MLTPNSYLDKIKTNKEFKAFIKSPYEFKKDLYLTQYSE